MLLEELLAQVYTRTMTVWRYSAAFQKFPDGNIPEKSIRHPNLQSKDQLLLVLCGLAVG